MRCTLFRLFAVGTLGAARAAVGQSMEPAEARMTRALAHMAPAAVIKGAPDTFPSFAAEMRRLVFPGVSIAVADGGRIVWAQGFGLRLNGLKDSVTPTTMFQAASISKPVTATATLRLVDQGKLSLDENVNTYLKSWKVPDNEFTATEKVTLRRILSHMAGTTGSSVGSYAPGVPLPTLPQILDGQAPANTRPIRVDVVPGTMRRYSGGGVTIEQLLLTDVVGKSFPDLMNDLVLGPIGMTHSTFVQQLPDSLEAQIAAAHLSNGLPAPARHKLYPEMAAAGLWSTPTDLLKWAIAVADARNGKSTSLLSRQMATQMLTPQNEDNGLGPALSGRGRELSFWHAGLNSPGYSSNVIYFPETGQGAAIMMNGGSGGAQLPSAVFQAIAKEFHWPTGQGRILEPIALDSVSLNGYVGTFAMGPDQVTLSREGTRLFLTTRSRKDQVVLIAKNRFVVPWSGQEATLTLDAAGRVSVVELFGMAMERRP